MCAVEFVFVFAYFDSLTSQPFHRNDTSMPKIETNTMASTILFLVAAEPYLMK